MRNNFCQTNKDLGMKRHLYSVPLDGNLVEQFPSNPHNDFKDGDGSGGGDDMLQRIKDLEKDMHGIKTDLAVMKSNYATKADVSDAKFSIIVWVVGAIFIAQLLPPIISAIKAAL